jgi:hypothetical protein
MSQMSQIVVAKHNSGTSHVMLARDGDSYRVLNASAQSLPAIIGDVFPVHTPDVTGMMPAQRSEPGGAVEFSFTTRTLDSVFAHPLPKEPTDLNRRLSNVSISILCPEQRGIDLWSALWIDPRAGHLSWLGAKSRFRVANLREEVNGIRGWFAREEWRSFSPVHHSEANDPMRRLPRVSWERELLVRPNWASREFAPHLFLTPEEIAREAAAAAAREASREAAAHDPRPLWDLEAAQLHGTPEVKAKAQAEIKRRFGLRPSAKIEPAPVEEDPEIEWKDGGPGGPGWYRKEEHA